MKKFLTSTTFIALMCFILGIAAVYAYQHLNTRRHENLVQKSDTFFDDLYDSHFFDHSKDPFEQMRRMQKQMMKEFDQPGLFENRFNSWYGNKFGGNIGEMKQREDADNVYYDIELGEGDPKTFEVKVVDGQVEIKGEIQKKDENSEMTQSFHRSFPAPDGVDTKNFESIREETKIVIKFPKLKI